VPRSAQGGGRHYILGGICGLICAGLLTVGLAVNAQRYWHLVRDGSYTFAALGAIIDLAAVSLLSAGALLWRDGHWGAATASYVMWFIFVPLSVIPTASYTAQFLGDRAAERGGVITQADDVRQQRAAAIAIAQANVAAAERRAKEECNRRGPHCRDREADERRARDALTTANAMPIAAAASVSAADPGPAMLASLFSWAGVTEKMIAQAWVAGLTIVPALAGMFMMFTTLLWPWRRRS